MEYLKLGGTQVTDNGLKHLRPMTKLRSLSLSGTDVSDEGMQHLGGLALLRTLHLDGTQVTDEGLEHLADLKNLRRLSVRGTSVTGNGVAGIRRSLPNANMGPQATPQQTPAGKADEKTPAPAADKLKQMTEEEAADFFRLREAMLVKLQGTNHYGHVLLRGSLLQDDDIRQLQHLPHLTRVTFSFSLGESPLTETGIKHLLNLRNLRSLDLHGRLFTDQSLGYVKELRGLEELELGFCVVTDEGMLELARLKNLKRVKLTGLSIGDAGLDFLAHLPRLEELRISILKNITDEGFAGLEFSVPDLRSLNIHRGSITRFEPQAYPGLEKLRLTDTDFTGPGLEHLVNVTNLALGGVKITDETLTHVKKMPNLTRLYLSKTMITEEAIAEFKKAKPACDVRTRDF